MIKSTTFTKNISDGIVTEELKEEAYARPPPTYKSKK